MESEKITAIKKALENQKESLAYIENNIVKIVKPKEILFLINELESGYAKGYADGIKNTYEVVMQERLNEFVESVVESLKEKVEFNTVDAFVECSRILKKTLKEFL